MHRSQATGWSPGLAGMLRKVVIDGQISLLALRMKSTIINGMAAC